MWFSELPFEKQAVQPLVLEAVCLSVRHRGSDDSWGAGDVPVYLLPCPWGLPDWFSDLQKRGLVVGPVGCSSPYPLRLPSLPSLAVRHPRTTVTVPVAGINQEPRPRQETISRELRKAGHCAHDGGVQEGHNWFIGPWGWG